MSKTLPAPSVLQEQIEACGIPPLDAHIIAAEVYLPLKEKIEQLEAAIRILAASPDISNGITLSVSKELDK